MGLREELNDLGACGLASAVEVIGERWSFLILRAAFNGTVHFEDFQSSLGIARNILASRLAKLVANNMLVREPMAEDRRKIEYRLTQKAMELLPVLIGLRQWGTKWNSTCQNAPVLCDVRDKKPVRPIQIYAHDGRPLGLHDMCWVVNHECQPLPEPEPEEA